MLTLSKPLSANQARTYHAEEFSNARVNYYSTDAVIHGAWHGQLAREWGLVGDVDDERFARLAEGQHPMTGDALVRHQTACRYTNAAGKTVNAMEHRAGWDATFSAPKSVSLTALVGRDDRVREAHRKAVAAALRELETYVQARLGGHLTPEPTGKWVAATFEHDSARPVNGYAAPQLHTHVVVFNLTRTQAGDVRPVQPQELYRSQQFATAVYRSALAARLHDLGYDLVRGASGQPEIRGYSDAYLEASSLRRQQIAAHLEAHDKHGAASAQVAAHHTREPKIDRSHAEMQRQHQDLAQAFGDQPAHIVEAAHARVSRLEPHVPRVSARMAVAYAESRGFEREAVVDERPLLRDALKLSMGEVSLADLRREMNRRVEVGEFIARPAPPGVPGRAFTTREMVDLERDTIAIMSGGQRQYHELGQTTMRDLQRSHPHLNADQLSAVGQVLVTHDRVVALEGIAGAGKTTALTAIRTEAERAGYQVEGFAPTSRAAQLLAAAGMTSGTLQQHLATRQDRSREEKQLYVLDESSLASTRQMHAFLTRLEPNDRVLLVGDTRQHHAVEAGRPYQQLREAGIQTARLDAIVRQHDPALKVVVEQLARGEVDSAIRQLDRQGRVHEVVDGPHRMRAIAAEYVRHTAPTLIVSPDNQSRMEINTSVRQARQEAGLVARREHTVTVLMARQDITGADRAWAMHYQPHDMVRYAKGSRVLGIEAAEYARVIQVDTEQNLITVRRSTGDDVTYDPRRLSGVTVYREAHRAFAAGDRVQLTAPDRSRHLANRELGTLERIDEEGRIQIRLDSGRTVRFRLSEHPHLDYGYAVTSYSSQGQTADRVLIHIDADRAPDVLVNRRLAYVAVSRARHDVQIYTNDRAGLMQALDRDISHQTALEFAQGRAKPEHSIGLGL
jgi:conjugative relaxase-like TrwC/TraI family protein